MSRLFADPVEKGAVISECGLYRFRLWRQWGSEPKVTFIMLNPSTADHTIDDPTIRRCMGFARTWGKGGIEVVNLFPWRATSPKDLVAAANDGMDIHKRLLRNEHMAASLKLSDLVVVAWGAHALATLEVKYALLGTDVLWCLGTNKNGSPKHPLYVPKSTTLQRWKR